MRRFVWTGACQWRQRSIRSFAASSSGSDGAAAPVRKPVGPGPQLREKASHFPGAPCWSCEQVFNPTNVMFCNGCNKLLPLLKEENYFQLLGLPVSFYVARDTLERNFQNLQRKVHPGALCVQSVCGGSFLIFLLLQQIVTWQSRRVNKRMRHHVRRPPVQRIRRLATPFRVPSTCWR